MGWPWRGPFLRSQGEEGARRHILGYVAAVFVSSPVGRCRVTVVPTYIRSGRNNYHGKCRDTCSARNNYHAKMPWYLFRPRDSCSYPVTVVPTPWQLFLPHYNGSFLCYWFCGRDSCSYPVIVVPTRYNCSFLCYLFLPRDSCSYPVIIVPYPVIIVPSCAICSAAVTVVPTRW